MPSHEPTPSERVLIRAMEDFGRTGRRANPSGSVAIRAQGPKPGAAWREVASLPSKAAAVAKAKGMTGLEPGTAILVGDPAPGAKPAWLGVADRSGRAVAPPPMPNGKPLREKPPGGELDWFSAWDGEGANAEWMINQCGAVGRARVALAAAAALRTALGYVPSGGAATAASKAVDGVEAWARGGAPRDASSLVRLRPLYETANAAARSLHPKPTAEHEAALSGALIVSGAAQLVEIANVEDVREGVSQLFDYAQTARNAVHLIDTAGKRDLRGGAREEAKRVQRAAAEAVRREIPLGAVLLSRLRS